MIGRLNFCLFLALPIAFGSVSPSQIEPDQPTGIEGVITVSPTRPGPLRKDADVSNIAPLPGAVFSVENDKGKVTSFTTDNQGRFRLLLKTGHYVITLAEHRFPRPCGPFPIDVVSDKITTVEWRCDTGMR